MQLQTEMVQEIDENRFRRHLEEHFFSVRAAFRSIFGSNLGPRLAAFGRLSADFRDFLGPFLDTCGFPSFEGARERARIDYEVPGDPPWKNFETFFGDSRGRFGHARRPESVPSLYKFCPKFGSVCRSSLAFSSQLAQTFSSRGGGPRSVLNSPYPSGVLAC